MKEIYKINLHNIIHVVSIEIIETFEKLPVDEEVAEFLVDSCGYYWYDDSTVCFVDMLFDEVNPMHEYFKSIIINHKRVEKLNELYE